MKLIAQMVSKYAKSANKSLNEALSRVAINERLVMENLCYSDLVSMYNKLISKDEVTIRSSSLSFHSLIQLWKDLLDNQGILHPVREGRHRIIAAMIELGSQIGDFSLSSSEWLANKTYSVKDLEDFALHMTIKARELDPLALQQLTFVPFSYDPFWNFPDPVLRRRPVILLEHGCLITSPELLYDSLVYYYSSDLRITDNKQVGCLCHS